MMPTRKLTLTALFVSLAMASSVALAQNPSFEEMDRDEDGYVSGSEAMALPCLAQVYDQLETEDERGLNRSEYNAAVQQHCDRSRQQGTQQQQEEDWPES